MVDLSSKEGKVGKVPYYSSRERERERERESPIQVGICYIEWVVAMVATTHWVLATVANTQLWVFATMSGYLLR